MKKVKAIKVEKTANLSDAQLLTLAAAKLKGRVLFPHSVEKARKHLQNVNLDALFR